MASRCRVIVSRSRVMASCYSVIVSCSRVMTSCCRVIVSRSYVMTSCCRVIISHSSVIASCYRVMPCRSRVIAYQPNAKASTLSGRTSYHATKTCQRAFLAITQKHFSGRHEKNHSILKL